jgi:hypothetical protein
MSQVDGSRQPDLVPLHRQDVADEHVAQMFGLAVDLLIVRMTAADATAYEMPMMASCGTLASCPLIIAKMKRR